MVNVIDGLTEIRSVDFKEEESQGMFCQLFKFLRIFSILLTLKSFVSVFIKKLSPLTDCKESAEVGSFKSFFSSKNRRKEVFFKCFF